MHTGLLQILHRMYPHPEWFSLCLKNVSAELSIHYYKVQDGVLNKDFGFFNAPRSSRIKNVDYLILKKRESYKRSFAVPKEGKYTHYD
jgi:hypothetical protein